MSTKNLSKQFAEDYFASHSKDGRPPVYLTVTTTDYRGDHTAELEHIVCVAGDIPIAQVVGTLDVRFGDTLDRIEIGIRYQEIKE